MLLSAIARQTSTRVCAPWSFGASFTPSAACRLFSISSSSSINNASSSSSGSSGSGGGIGNVEPAVEYQKEIEDIEKQYEERKKRRQSMIGVVVSDKCSKSVTIKVEREKYFPKYDKHVTRTRKFMAHDEEERCEMGDVIRIVPCRPMSKMKRHMVIDIIKKGQRLDLSPTSSSSPTPVKTSVAT